MTASRGKILTFANPKGGVGKSTLSCLITAMLKWSNKHDSIQLIDADKQGSSVSLLQRICKDVPCSHYPISYEYDKLNLILLSQLMENTRMKKGNILVIDTPARPGQEGIELFTKSHAVIVPVSNTMAELPPTLAFVKKIDKLYDAYWDSVKDFEKLLKSKGLKKEALTISAYYHKLVGKFDTIFKKLVSKLL